MTDAQLVTMYLRIWRDRLPLHPAEVERLAFEIRHMLEMTDADAAAWWLQDIVAPPYKSALVSRVTARVAMLRRAVAEAGA